MAGRWPLVGRDAELAGLRRLLDGERGPRGAAVFGDAGVGKTRLMKEAVDACRSDGMSVEWVRATEAARQISLGAFAHLLTRDPDALGRDDLLHVALARLHKRSRSRRFLLAVDDAHHLDEMSVALLHLAVTQARARLLLSVRTGEAVPTGLIALWKDEVVSRVDVLPLAREATEQLVASRLGEDVTASLLDRIWYLSQGNPLFVRELVHAVECRNATGDAPLTLGVDRQQDRLRALVEERLRLLDPPSRATLEIVAVGEQVPLEAVLSLTAASHVEALERHGLVEVVDTDRTAIAQVAHPLYGEVLAASMPQVRRRALLQDLVRAAEHLHDFDRLRLGVWQLGSGAPGEPDELLLLAREALGRLDHVLAERLARAAGAPEDTAAGLVLADALSGQGRMGDADWVLGQLRPSDPGEVAGVAIARASALFLHLDRSPEAFDVMHDADAKLAGQPLWQAECRSVLAQMCMFGMRLAEGRQIADDLLETSDDISEPARVRAVSVAVSAWGAEGRLDAALALLDDDIYALARRHRQAVHFGELQLRMARFQILYWAGRIHEVDAYTSTNLGVDVDRPPPSLRGILAGFRGGALLLRGHGHHALAELQRSSRLLGETDWFGQRPLAEAMRARAAVFAGDLQTAGEAIDAADAAFAADRLRGARTLPYIELSRAWVLAAQGHVADAGQRCLALAAAMEQAVAPIAVEALHAAVRLGRAGDAVDPLERLTRVVDGPFVKLAFRHAYALARPEADLLASIAADFADLGADLLAAEAERSAANAFLRDGRGASASSAARRVDEALRRAGQPTSPTLEQPVRLGEELTGREREVALLAAGGRTSPEIADTLFLSVRTVDTHLHHVYRKLRIDGRHQLGEALGNG